MVCRQHAGLRCVLSFILVNVCIYIYIYYSVCEQTICVCWYVICVYFADHEHVLKTKTLQDVNVKSSVSAQIQQKGQ